MYIIIISFKYLVNGQPTSDAISIYSHKIFNSKFSCWRYYWIKICIVSLWLFFFEQYFICWSSNQLVWHRTVKRNASKNRTKFWKLNCQHLRLALLHPTSHLPPSCIDFTCKADWETWKLWHVKLATEGHQTHCNEVGIDSHIWILYLHHFDQREIK